jgi:hypothetical protein
VKLRDTLLGLLAVALVAGGVYWTRTRSHGAAPPSHGGPSNAPMVSGGADELPDAGMADVTVAVGDLRMTLSVSPRPPIAFSTKRFRVRVTSADGTPVALDEGRISFEMVMPMGDHRYTLLPSADGWLEAEVVLPFCKSGNPTWFAVAEGTIAGRPVAARFRVDLTKPGATPAESVPAIPRGFLEGISPALRPVHADGRDAGPAASSTACTSPITRAEPRGAVRRTAGAPPGPNPGCAARDPRLRIVDTDITANA